MERILNEVNPLAKEVLFYAYKNDLSFPRSCGLVSNILTYLLKNTSLPSKYEIKCVRGIFKDLENVEWCDEEDVYEIDRYNYKSYNCICCECGCCDFMNPHSWIELINKKTKKEYILDFTQIQFDEDFCNFQQEILNFKWNKEDLFHYITHNSYVLMEESDILFQYYIPLEKEISLEKMKKYVDKEKNNSYYGMVINFLNWMKENKEE